ncbi:hypothetical protein HYU18_00615 [Candidatus Woesearchaeota archaeon]|nr:hypothetical protein [Candidatus Woesearchaeota archaeon]
MTIDEDIFASFKTFCKENGMKVSTKVEQLMKDNVKNATLGQFLRAPAASADERIRR